MKPIIIITTPTPLSKEEQEKLSLKGVDSGSLILVLTNSEAKEPTLTVIHDSTVTVTKL